MGGCGDRRQFALFLVVILGSTCLAACGRGLAEAGGGEITQDVDEMMPDQRFSIRAAIGQIGAVVLILLPLSALAREPLSDALGGKRSSRRASRPIWRRGTPALVRIIWPGMALNAVDEARIAGPAVQHRYAIRVMSAMGWSPTGNGPTPKTERQLPC